MLPNWIVDIGTIGSIIGTVISIVSVIFNIVIYSQTKSIKDQFLSKARLPESTKELTDLASSISSNFNNWEDNKDLIYSELAKTKGLIENLSPKLDKKEQKVAKNILVKLNPSKKFTKVSIVNLSEDQVWEVYCETQQLIVQLNELIKDGKWN